MENFEILRLVTNRITELSILILNRKLYSKEFEKFIDIAMDSNWAEANYEVIDSCPTALNPWKPTKNNTNFKSMKIGTTHNYEIWAELTTNINSKISESSDIVIDITYNAHEDTLIFNKVFCP